MYVAKLESAERGKVICMWPNLNQQKGGKLHVCGQTWISRKGKVTCMWPNWNQQKGGKLHVCGQTGISRKGESYMYVAKLESAERGKVTCMWPNWNQQKGGKLHVCGQTGISRKGESYMYVAKLGFKLLTPGSAVRCATHHTMNWTWLILIYTAIFFFSTLFTWK